MALPVLTAQQRVANLEKAAEARKIRRELLDAVTAGELSIAEVLDRADDDLVVRKTRVSAVIKALPGYGTVKAAKLLDDLNIAEGRRVGGLGATQRVALLAALYE